jgi:hypothetical protein
VTPVPHLEVHGRIDGDVDGAPVSIVGRGREVDVTVPRLGALRESLPDGAPLDARTALRALAAAGLVINVDGPRGRLASVGDVGPGLVRPGRASLRPLAIALAAVAAAVAGVVAWRARHDHAAD